MTALPNEPATHPGNAFAHCPRCGAAGFSPGPDNSVRCAPCGLRWYYNAACAVDVIVERPDGHILVTRRERDPGRGLLDLPGGFVNADETVEAAAHRELYEETGLDAGDLVWFGSFPNRYEYGGVLYFAVDLIFRTTVDATAALRVGDDVAAARFVDPMTIAPADVGLDSTRAAIAAYQAWRATRSG